ncbi:MAG: hypothetical protein ABJA57_06185 [Ginsengibacter sp.]
MQHVISSHTFRTFRHEPYAATYINQASLLSRFVAWCNKQEDSRLFWMGMALLGGIGAVLPLTLMAVVFFAANNFSLWIIACVVNVPVLVVNLAAQPQKVTLPVLFFAWMIDVLIIAYSIAVVLL